MNAQELKARMNAVSAMDTFERARHRYAKHRKANEKYLPHLYGLPPRVVAKRVEPDKEVVVVPNEKQERHPTDAIFKVSVSLPDKEIALTLTKTNIYANAPKSRMTEAEIRKAIASGLSSLMGDVK